MQRFWGHYIKPIFETVQPKRVLEIGADAGWNTRNILAYCRATGARADIIDPAPAQALFAVLADYPQEQTYHRLRSVAAIPALEAPDIALIDGDHNWCTVYEELELLYGLATKAAPPIILLHDVAWPYARRDMYYNADAIHPTQRHPHAHVGMLPGVSELVETGINGVLANATHEGGPRNGVLTAVEDFIASTGVEVAFFKLPFFNGLGILVPSERMTSPLQVLVDSFYKPESLLEACEQLELNSIQLAAQLTQTQALLTRRTEALLRARELLAQKTAELDRGAPEQKTAELDAVCQLNGNGAVADQHDESQQAGTRAKPSSG
jgi:hypothetical protein